MLFGGVHRRMEDADRAAYALHMQVEEDAERRRPTPQNLR